MKKYSINENYIATQGQQIFNIEKPFINDTISVFVNGILQILGEDKDYLTVQDTGKVIFNNPLNENDMVSIISNIASKRINLEIISSGKADKPNALYKKYGTVKRLKENNKYEIQICIDKDIYKWNFVSKLNPLFVSSKKIWEDIGEFIEGFTEEYINSMIYRNSVEVIELIDELANSDDAIENVTYEKDADGNYTTTSRAIKNWVKYKTELQLVMARYYGISYKYGSVRKEIGDISIEKSTKLPYIDNLLDGLKDQFEEADNAIRGINIVASGVKAITNYSYEDWARETNF
jgi:hypothetical protein